ncbi:hypothetical protein PQE71_gp018 [Bacillus phage Izhevsk]|uniref:Uncharacterized protein n=1 Tax=Bacillus phage Izhevsk TaxID=2724322 RepID=A0A6H0X5V2_9CAUD|nr:hypothetical protein PQE71_gp018 [Bacillus phage Izhevsk]QIW89700.1 hypothetical protein Izhevsk_18 [Bacillus phage Izhevsk]
MKKSTVHIYAVFILGGDTFYKVEMPHEDYVQRETFCAESMGEIIRRSDIEVTYDEEFEVGEITIESMLDQDNLSCVEICSDDTDGEYDVYFHKVTAKYGEVTYDADGEFIKTYKRLKSAQSKALTLSNNII